MSSPLSHVLFLTTPHAGDWVAAQALLWPWAVQFVASWVGFLFYMSWDWAAFCAGTLERDKLPSRHPLHESPLEPSAAQPDGSLVLWETVLPRALCPRVSVFWYSQLFMVPLVLFNQLVVWPLTSFLLIWPQWAVSHTPWDAWAAASWGGSFGACCRLVGLILLSDQMWYWCHRAMHLPWCWKHLHKMHHIAPQCALSATYVHPVEYALFTLCMQLPAAIVGYPIAVYIIPMAWGMLTGGGAHSGYGGDIANGEKHGTGHHLYHSANFGLLMVADAMYGTHWSPGDPPPAQFRLAQVDIEDHYKDVKGAGAAEALALVQAARVAAEAKAAGVGVRGDGNGGEPATAAQRGATRLRRAHVPSLT